MKLFLIFFFSINSFAITCVDDDIDLNPGDVISGLSRTTYTDSLSSGTKWYRVYGVNASGVSTGSNVVSVTYSE